MNPQTLIAILATIFLVAACGSPAAATPAPATAAPPPTEAPAITAAEPMAISMGHEKTSYNNGRCYQEITATITNWTDDDISASAVIVGAHLSSHEQAGDPHRSLIIGTDADGHGQIQIHFWAVGEASGRASKIKWLH